ncbi:acyltransferase family protein [Konateibacter massiliensis]|uniref:acyltransferase family protein n=1 Tax=Konateibacter massiliensis TaxID=2002841 RepID=UPI000C145797|nr:acyltransferase family protein [Konateibacter massiliensis]
MSILVKEEVNTGRQFEFDVAKTLAIFFMVIVHVCDNMSVLDSSIMPQSFLHLVIKFFGAPMAAPIFMFAMGVGMVYTKHDSPKEFASRGVKLILMGYALNFFRETLLMIIAKGMELETDYQKALIDTIGTIDILQFAGMAFLLVALMKQLSLKPWMLLCAALVFQVFGTLFIGSFDSVPKVLQYVLGLMFYTNHYIAFPATLWLIYPVMGICFAYLLRRVSDKHNFYSRVLWLSVVALISVTAGSVALGIDVRCYFVGARDSYYQQNFISTLWIASIIGVSISVYYYFSCLIEGRIQNTVKYISANLNTIYIMQWLLITYSIAIKEILGLGNLTVYWVIPIGVLIAVVCMFFTWVWNHMKQRL